VLAAAGDSVGCVVMKPVKVVSVDKRLQVFINGQILLASDDDDDDLLGLVARGWITTHT